MAYRVFGFGIWQTRLLPLLSGGVAVWLGGVIPTRVAKSTSAGAAASLLIAVDPRFITTARGSRMDTPAIALLMVAFLLPIDHSRGTWARLLVESAAAAALTHPLSVVWVVVLLLMHLRKGIRNCVVFASGGMALGAIWLFWMWPNRQFFKQQFIHHGATRAERG